MSYVLSGAPSRRQLQTAGNMCCTGASGTSQPAVGVDVEWRVMLSGRLFLPRIADNAGRVPSCFDCVQNTIISVCLLYVMPL